MRTWIANICCAAVVSVVCHSFVCELVYDLLKQETKCMEIFKLNPRFWGEILEQQQQQRKIQIECIINNNNNVIDRSLQQKNSRYLSAPKKKRPIEWMD